MASSTISLCAPLYTTTRRNTILQRKARRDLQVSSIGRDAQDYNYNKRRSVDENMIILRRRIHEMKIIERNYEPPAEWMDWEKKCYVHYGEMICEALGIVQKLLINARPSMALGLGALMVLSVPFSSAVVLWQFSELIKIGLQGIHFS